MEPHLPAVLILIDDGFDDLELMYPKLRLTEAGYHVFTAGKQRGKTYIGHYGYPCVADESIYSVQERHYAGVICPGGRAAEQLRCEGKVKSLVHDFQTAGKLVATICTGGWIAISAGVLRGVRVTGSPAILDDLVNCGAVVEEGAGVAIDGNVITAASTNDLPVFMKSVLQVLASELPAVTAAASHA
jgi:protease I